MMFGSRGNVTINKIIPVLLVQLHGSQLTATAEDNFLPNKCNRGTLSNVIFSRKGTMKSV